MGILKKYFNQTRKPEGFLGKMMVNGMNGGHAKLADWGMSFLKEVNPESVVDLGCGGGRNAGELMNKYPHSKVTAIDYSEVSVEKAREYNNNMISSGRCRVLQGDVSKLAFDSDSFELATAFETVYFWGDLEKCFSEVRRVLKDGGTFLICNESDGKDETSLKFEKIIDGMKCYTPEQLTAVLKSVGFTSIQSEHHPSKPWITVIAKK
ncbi:MAG: methyltransferase domain-containing protein [Ruminococcaceae bacterium]|jgi:ubiquinone/menaquinone biosynthesis C-methylase UbiE|nr:methyltransferase domain-containing protein [Oscillospiraceae bacterium]